ncbi:MAG: ABC transporter transmembrane domain-containing protein, partial [Defluviitaleaceae bacterium]|nr:ABC transporter transmembrane domain-containing protein [Defluviitaleaceae bacterium]
MKAMLGLILRGSKTKLLLGSFMTVAIGAGFLLVFANDLLAVVLNDYLMVQHFEGLAWRLLLTAGVFALVYGLQTFGDYLSADFEYSAISRLMRHYVSKLLGAKYEFFLHRPAAETYTGLWTAAQTSGFFFGNLLRLMSSIVIFAFYGVVVFRLDVFAGIFTVAALPIYFLLTAGFSEKIVTLNSQYLEHISNLSTVTQEGFENIANVKAKGAYGFFVSRSAAALRKIKTAAVKEITIIQYISNVTRLLRIIAPLLIIFAVMRFSSGFEASAGTIMVLYINIPLFLVGFASIVEHFIEWMATKPYLAKLKEFDNAQPEESSGKDIATFESLQVQGVKVTYDSGREVAVPDFEIKAGEKVMFFGESGIGKSTVFNIIMGFQPYEGKVLVNGIDLREISLHSL